MVWLQRYYRWVGFCRLPSWQSHIKFFLQVNLFQVPCNELTNEFLQYNLLLIGVSLHDMVLSGMHSPVHFPLTPIPPAEPTLLFLWSFHAESPQAPSCLGLSVQTIHLYGTFHLWLWTWLLLQLSSNRPFLITALSKYYPFKNPENHLHLYQFQFSSVLSRVWLCDPMNHSTSGLPVRHQLPESTQTHVHWVGDAIQPSHLLSSPSLSAPNPSQHQGLFQWVNSSHEVAKVIGISASSSVLPMNTQDWSPLEWTGWISLHSKELSRVFSNTTVQKHQFFRAQLSL